jgi:hypothetical protein
MWFSMVSSRSARRALPPGGQGPYPGLRRRSPRDAGARSAGGKAEGPARRETAAEGPPKGRFLLVWRDRERRAGGNQAWDPTSGAGGEQGGQPGARRRVLTAHPQERRSVCSCARGPEGQGALRSLPAGRGAGGRRRRPEAGEGDPPTKGSVQGLEIRILESVQSTSCTLYISINPSDRCVRIA